LITIAISIVTAIGSTAIYIHDLMREMNTLRTDVNTLSQRIDARASKAEVNALSQRIDIMSQQLKRVSPVTSREVDFWNGVETQQCEKGSFMVGARIGIGAQ
jgi:hypothetical protein